MKINKPIQENIFAIYGLGLSGSSAFKFLKKKKVKKIYTWDDKKSKNKENSNSFIKALNIADYIVISPGINIKKTTDVQNINPIPGVTNSIFLFCLNYFVFSFTVFFICF